MSDPYHILGVAPETADDNSIRQAYLAGLRVHPPERDPSGFQRLRDAYDKLSSQRRRLAYALFHAEIPDVAELSAHALAPDESRRPSVATLRAALSDSLKSS